MKKIGLLLLLLLPSLVLVGLDVKDLVHERNYEIGCEIASDKIIDMQHSDSNNHIFLQKNEHTKKGEKRKYSALAQKIESDIEIDLLRASNGRRRSPQIIIYTPYPRALAHINKKKEYVGKCPWPDCSESLRLLKKNISNLCFIICSRSIIGMNLYIMKK